MSEIRWIVRYASSRSDRVDAVDQNIVRAISEWVAQHNRRDEGSFPGRHDMFFEREESGLKVTDHTTFYPNDDGMGSHTVALYNGQVVFEQAGLTVKTFVPGHWMKIVTTA